MANDEIVLTSTTDSPAEVLAALTGKPVEQVEAEAAAAKTAESAAAEVKTEEVPAPEAKTEPEAKIEPETPPANETPEQKAERERKSAGDKRVESIQKRINVEWAKKGEAERARQAEELRLAQVRAEIAELEAKRASAAAPAPAETPKTEAKTETPATSQPARPEPQLGDNKDDGSPRYANYEEWLSDHAKWTIEESTRQAAEIAAKAKADLEAAERARIERESASRADAEVLARHHQQVEAFMQTHADFDAVVESVKPTIDALTKDLGPDALSTLDRFTTTDASDGPALMYHLAQNPDELDRIVRLHPARQLIELARIDTRLEHARQPARASDAAPVTKAPEPIKPLGSTPTTSGAPDPEKETFREYAERRNREEAKAKGLVPA